MIFLLIIITIELTIITFYIINRMFKDYGKQKHKTLRKDEFRRKYYESLRERMNGV